MTCRWVAILGIGMLLAGPQAGFGQVEYATGETPTANRLVAISDGDGDLIVLNCSVTGGPNRNNIQCDPTDLEPDAGQYLEICEDPDHGGDCITYQAPPALNAGGNVIEHTQDGRIRSEEVEERNWVLFEITDPDGIASATGSTISPGVKMIIKGSTSAAPIKAAGDTQGWWSVATDQHKIAYFGLCYDPDDDATRNFLVDANFWIESDYNSFPEYWTYFAIDDEVAPENVGSEDPLSARAIYSHRLPFHRRNGNDDFADHGYSPNRWMMEVSLEDRQCLYLMGYVKSAGLTSTFAPSFFQALLKEVD